MHISKEKILISCTQGIKNLEAFQKEITTELRRQVFGVYPLSFSVKDRHLFLEVEFHGSPQTLFSRGADVGQLIKDIYNKNLLK